MDENADAPAGTRARREGNRSQPNPRVTRRCVATDCRCQACVDLRAECGEHVALYRRKLLIRGWAGVKSPAETAYCRVHRSDAQQARAAALSARAKSGGFAPRITVTDGDTGAGGSSTRIVSTQPPKLNLEFDAP